MTKTPKKAKSRSALPGKPAVNLPATVKPRTGSQPEPQADMAREHPHKNLDRAMRAAAARLTGGVSPHAFIEAWGDWALHISRAPGRQLELVERAQRNAARLISQAMAADSETAPAFVPKAYDHRFDHPGWQKLPFQMWQQGFLAMQDWWDYATDPLRGLRPEDAGRTRFMIRQMLDTVSPSNFPALNPEIIEETAKTGGKNLSEVSCHVSL